MVTPQVNPIKVLLFPCSACVNLLQERLIFLSPTVQAAKERECTLADFEILGGLGAGQQYSKQHQIH